MKINNKKGFTLAELLIVVAIIAALVAIAIPIFMSEVEKSRESTDLANVRSAYSELMNYAMTEKNPPSDSAISKNNKTYSVSIELKQQEKGWATDGPINVGGIDSDKDKDSYWFDEPEPEGICTITYTTGDAKGKLYWGGSFYDHKTNFATGIASYLASKNTKNNPNLNCINSTCSSSGTIQAILGKITDEKTNSEIKTWAAVRNPSDRSDSDAYNYLYSTVDISKLSAGTQVPAIMCDKNGNYSVGYATVNKAPDGNYKVITLDSNGKYPPVSSNEKDYYSNEYDAATLLSQKTEYSSGSAAQAAYERLLKEYSSK